MPPVPLKLSEYRLRRRYVPVHPISKRVRVPSSFLNISNPLESGLLPAHLMGISSSSSACNCDENYGYNEFNTSTMNDAKQNCDKLIADDVTVDNIALELFDVKPDEKFDIVEYCEDNESNESSNGWSGWTENDFIDQIVQITEESQSTKVADLSAITAIEQSLLYDSPVVKTNPEISFMSVQTLSSESPNFPIQVPIAANEQALSSDSATGEADRKPYILPAQMYPSESTSFPIKAHTVLSGNSHTDETSGAPFAAPIIVKLEFLSGKDQKRNSTAENCVSATISSTSMSRISSVVSDIIKLATPPSFAATQRSDTNQVDTKQSDKDLPCELSVLTVPSGCDNTARTCRKLIGFSGSIREQGFSGSGEWPICYGEEILHGRSPCSEKHLPQSNGRQSAKACLPLSRRRSLSLYGSYSCSKERPHYRESGSCASRQSTHSKRVALLSNKDSLFQRRRSSSWDSGQIHRRQRSRVSVRRQSRRATRIQYSASCSCFHRLKEQASNSSWSSSFASQRVPSSEHYGKTNSTCSTRDSFSTRRELPSSSRRSPGTRRISPISSQQLHHLKQRLACYDRRSSLSFRGRSPTCSRGLTVVDVSRKQSSNSSGKSPRSRLDLSSARNESTISNGHFDLTKWESPKSSKWCRRSRHRSSSFDRRPSPPSKKQCRTTSSRRFSRSRNHSPCQRNKSPPICQRSSYSQIRFSYSKRISPGAKRETSVRGRHSPSNKRKSSSSSRPSPDSRRRLPSSDRPSKEQSSMSSRCICHSWCISSCPRRHPSPRANVSDIPRRLSSYSRKNQSRSRSVSPYPRKEPHATGRRCLRAERESLNSRRMPSKEQAIRLTRTVRVSPYTRKESPSGRRSLRCGRKSLNFRSSSSKKRSVEITRTVRVSPYAKKESLTPCRRLSSYSRKNQSRSRSVSPYPRKEPHATGRRSLRAERESLNSRSMPFKEQAIRLTRTVRVSPYTRKESPSGRRSLRCGRKSLNFRSSSSKKRSVEITRTVRVSPYAKKESLTPCRRSMCARSKSRKSRSSSSFNERAVRSTRGSSMFNMPRGFLYRGHITSLLQGCSEVFGTHRGKRKNHNV